MNRSEMPKNWFQEQVLHYLKEINKTMSQLSDATDALQTTIDKLATDNAKALKDLQDAVAAGNTADVQAAITKLTAINTQLQGIDAADIAADPSSVTPPPPVA